MNQKLIALDLDGTTLNNQSQLSQRTKQVLQTLQQQDHHVMIATGRPFRNSKQIYEALGLKSPLVNFNGALCHIPHNRHFNSYYHHTLTKELAIDILESSNNMGIQLVCIEGKEELFTSAALPVTPFFPADTPATLLTHYNRLAENPTALSLFSPEERHEEIRSAILERYGSMVEIRTWGGPMPCLEVVSAGVQKALGVETVASYYGIERQDILAFGDEDNDYEMIEYAGHGVVMKNGIDKLKTIANDITAFTNDEDGVAEYLADYFGLDI